MDYDAVENILLDVPWTFKRTGYVYTALIASMAAALARNTEAIDTLASGFRTVPDDRGRPTSVPASPSMTMLATARWGWLDAVGRLFNIIRNELEIDQNFRNRILVTLTTPRGTARAIERFVFLLTRVQCTVTENFSSPSYQLNFQSPVSDLQLQQIVFAVNWVRPAGVPFLPIFSVSGGLFLKTLNYFGVKSVSGSYLTKTITSITIQLGANTNNPVSTLPVVYLVDPYIRGQVPLNLGL